MPRFTSFSSHVEDLIKKFHQAINDANYDLVKSLWLNEESVSFVDQTGELYLGGDDIIEALKPRQYLRVDVLGCKSHSFAGLIITETLEAWTHTPPNQIQAEVNAVNATAEVAKNIKAYDSSQFISQASMQEQEAEPEVEYIYGTYITTQNYPDWQLMRVHLSYANYAAVSFRCFEHVKGFH